MIQNMGEVQVITIMEARITEMSDIRDIGEELMGQLETMEKPQIILDFSKVTYLPSAMIGKLTAMHKKAKSYKGSLKMCAIAPGVLQIFKITKLDKVFDIQPDVSSAMASFKSSFIKL
ncbi:MAG: STAS domain-containing protein [Planctomycetota bacterium]|nr:STAS domain-containing protein [Planctomycetota bacterium]MDP7249559.1 STAS domain-containing protein [Planctomycetota bacterium]